MRINLSVSVSVIVAVIFCGCASMGDKNSMKVATPEIPKTTVTVTDFGAVGDGQTLNTEAFAKAIASLSEKGGGELIVRRAFG
jgi:polygalacturonase